MAEIRPEEISAILREQLSQSRTAAELQEVGTVLTIGDGVARIYGLTKVQAGELIEFENGLHPKVKNKTAYILACLDLVKKKTTRSK